LDQCGVGRHAGPKLCAERPAAHASWWIEVYVENGSITLDGNVPTLAYKDLAGDVARQIPGARAVINALNVAPT
jgi:osmotically-inducible protein OsmY